MRDGWYFCQPLLQKTSDEISVLSLHSSPIPCSQWLQGWQAIIIQKYALCNDCNVVLKNSNERHWTFNSAIVNVIGSTYAWVLFLWQVQKSAVNPPPRLLNTAHWYELGYIYYFFYYFLIIDITIWWWLYLISSVMYLPVDFKCAL